MQLGIDRVVKSLSHLKERLIEEAYSDSIAVSAKMEDTLNIKF